MCSDVDDEGLTSNAWVQYGTLQFGKFEEIQKKGYHSALAFLEKFDAEGRLPSAFVGEASKPASGRTRGRSARRNSI